MERHCYSCDGRNTVCFCCGKSFISFSSLQTHIFVHMGERPLHCEKCFKTFCSKTSLMTHVNEHFRKPCYACRKCGSSFYNVTHFFAHSLSCTVHKNRLFTINTATK
uniref:Sal-like protein 1 n=1 Tax=Parasteatoda tepidariorum TaxID=114398 RepID=A0A2L2YSJ0_PARTP